jgi:hypothetical protein
MHRWALYFGISLMLSVMYQAYFSFNFLSGEISEGSEVRLVLKILAISSLIFNLKDSLRLAISIKSLCFLLPIIFILGNIFLLIPWLNSEDIQSVNFLLFSFLIFLKPSPKFDEIILKIFQIISWVILFQLIIAAVLYSELPKLWDNGAIVGGMGNPNVFGLFLLLSAIYFYVIERKFYIPIILVMGTFGTGSLVSMMMGCCALVYFYIKSNKISSLFFFGVMTLLILSVSEILPLTHIFGKLDAAFLYLSNGDSSGSLSVSARLNYYLDGLNLLSEFPLAIFFGHPNGILFYSGDGLYIYYLVSFGLFLFFSFIVSNLILLRNAINTNNQLNKFLGIILGIYLIYFFTNRILDYWPAAFPYLLAMVYLSKKES